MVEANVISEFQGEYRFLSNFYPCGPIHTLGFAYPTVEHAYQASKTFDKDVHLALTLDVSPGQAKRFGASVDLRPDWDDVKLGIMRGLLEQKFAPTTELWRMLQATKGSELIEGNTWGDTFWGQCPIGTGKNHLGLLLMSIRDDISKIEL